MYVLIRVLVSLYYRNRKGIWEMKKRDKFIVCDLCHCKNSLNDALANDDYDKIGKDKIVIYCGQCGNSIIVEKKMG